MPRSAKSVEAHFRAEENGRVLVTSQPGSGWVSARAARVALGDGSAAATAPRASVGSPSSRVSTEAREISPVVMVPVLSRHNTSTRASNSTEASSLHSARRRAKATTPVMNARLVRRTRPSGTMATAAATVPRSASGHWSSVASRRSSNSPAAGGMITTSQRRMALTPARSSLSASLNRRASSDREAAYESAPTRVAR